jgi:NhaP-type Na+/H+ or K+/H+ antiporter
LDIMLGLAALLVLGMAAQWIAWRLKLPSILLLLLFGFFAGPHWFDLGIADLVRRELLFPVVSLSVALILFEGGMTLKLTDLKKHGRVVLRLISVGALVTWVLATLAAWSLAGFDFELALLLGAILTVSGPTVVLPLLRHINPRGRSGSILTWEGIAIDPVGAVLALLVYEGLVSTGGWGQDTGHALVGLLKTAAIGGAGGLAGGWLLVQMLRRYWIPDHLHIPVTLALVVAVFSGTNALQHECGLLAVTVMGIYAANQSHVSVHHILEFKENLRVLLLSSLFILLAARLATTEGMEALGSLDMGVIAFLAALILVVRPLAVWFSTRGSQLSREEKIFLAWLCPRGIVAAAVASVFGFQLTERGYAGAELLMPVTFVVIVGTVVVYGLTSGPVARRLGLAIPNPQGVVFVGASSWVRELAKALQGEGIQVLLVDANRRNVREARLAELPTHRGNALEEEVGHSLDLFGMGRVLAVTPNDEVNTLVTLHYAHTFGRSETYRLAPDTVPAKGRIQQGGELGGRTLFAADADYYALSARFGRGRIRVTPLTEQFDFEAFLTEHGERVLPLFVIEPDGGLTVATPDLELKPGAGAKIVALVDEPPPSTAGESARDTSGL